VSGSYDFREPEFLTVGTLGPKGQREFFLQARGEGQLVSLKMEKQQVAALADYLDRVLDELPAARLGELPTDLGLREPVVAAWTVGSLGIAYAQDLDQVIVMAEAVGDGDEEDDDDLPRARFSLSREQVAGLIGRARELVAAGRAPCPYCGRPLEPKNHDWCPCHN
jgi:uncharacterized repeat protein (TIGR03847 family)